MRPSRFLTATAVAALLLSGCSDDEPTPEFSDDVTASSTAADPSTTPVTDEPARLGPVESVRAWVSAHNKVVAGEPADDVYALSSPECETCKEIVEPIIETYDDGGRFETTGWRITSARADPDFESNSAVLAGVTFEAGQTYQDETSEPIAYEAERHILQFRMVRMHGSWVVDAIAFVS